MKRKIRLMVASAVCLATASAVAWGPAGAGDVKPTKGPIPDAAFRADGSMDQELIPTFIPTMNQQGVEVGWVRFSDVQGDTQNGTNNAIPVYADDLAQLVGHMYPARGFVPLGTNPESVKAIDIWVGDGKNTWLATDENRKAIVPMAPRGS